MNATAFPLHPHLPVPKTSSTCCRHRIRSASSISSQRSGLNRAASFPKVAVDLCGVMKHWPIRVPPGMNCPLMVSPSGGTSLATRLEDGGLMRSPSYITAYPLVGVDLYEGGEIDSVVVETYLEIT